MTGLNNEFMNDLILHKEIQESQVSSTKMSKGNSK